jgi:hypothetical protein
MTIATEPLIRNETDHRAVFIPACGDLGVCRNGDGETVAETVLLAGWDFVAAEQALAALGWEPTSSGWWQASPLPGEPDEYDCYVQPINEGRAR